jgi:hypothetical protein
MTTPAEYRSRADECDDLARITKDSDIRATLLELAAEWRAIAAQDGEPARGRQIWVDPTLTTPGRRPSN